MKLSTTLAALLLATAIAPPATAQPTRSLPTAAPLVRSVPDPIDTPFPGILTLHVDASGNNRSIFRAREEIPVVAGTRKLTLLYPEWRPGNHSATGRMAQLSELRFSVAGKPIAWRRDPLEPFAFHLELPEGAATVTAELTYTGALQGSDGQVLFNTELMDLQWDRLSLYPAGHYARQVRIRPSVTLPAGWSAAVALDGETAAGDTRTYAVTDYETLADSPLFAGRNYKRWDLGQNVFLDLFADDVKDLAAKPELIDAHRKLVAEALALFGGKHFDRYHFLMALSGNFYGIGTEHQRSTEMQADPAAYRDPAAHQPELGVVPHEFAHSWNGKFKRPARLWTPDFRQPMQADLLWVYEGQTQFWGNVLGVRSGMIAKEMQLGEWANAAAGYSVQAGRVWRSVEDTTAEPVTSYHESKVWPTLGRGTDYYREAALVWLEVDQVLRKETGGKRGLDDFARAFFGGNDQGQVTYELEDVVTTLQGLASYDWRGFFATRIQSPGQPAPLAGIEAGGYRLVFRDTPNPYEKALSSGPVPGLTHSLGLSLDAAGRVTAVRWGGPAFEAGIVPTSQIMAVNGRAFSGPAIREAVVAAKDSSSPLELLVKRGEQVTTAKIDYHGGLRYPWLEPVSNGEQPLDRLLAARTEKSR